MFYIEKLSKSRRKLAFVHFGPTLLVFLAFMILTVWSSIDASRSARNSRNAALDRNTAIIQSNITERLGKYEDMLRSGVGLFRASDKVSRSEWQQFIDVFEIDERTPGIQAIGYIDLLGPTELENHISEIQAEGFADYTVKPEGIRDLYSSIVYIEPMNELNKRVLGYDLYSEPKRFAAMELAKKSGNTTVTEIAQPIITNNSTNAQPVFLMFVPLYEKGLPQSTEAERNASIAGFIYGGFRTFDFLSNTTSDIEKFYGFKVNDNQPEGELLFQSQSYEQLSKIKGTSSHTKTIKVYNQTWNLTAVISPEVVPTRERNRPTSVLWGGLLFSSFVAGFIFLLLQNRTRSLTQKEEREVQEAKDELLALASHQLRTPATGVKQYIGMLREGYVGKLNNEQLKILDKAYSSNERQLGTINEMLSVAKADAGTIDYRFEDFNLSKLLRRIIEEHSLVIRERHQNLTTKIPRKRIMINGDQSYIRMAVENIISNATKYTPEKGNIFITLKEAQKEIRLIVEDNGVGVHEKDYPLLFRKFSRIPNELTGKVSGSGIGLYLAKKVIESHKGSIIFTSSEGSGSTCTIIFSKDDKKIG